LERRSRELPSSSSAAPAGALRWRTRSCALVFAIVCAGVAGPGKASAADSLGVDELVGQIEAEVSTEVAAAVPQPTASSSRTGVQDAANVAMATAEGIADEAPAAAGPTPLAVSDTATQADETALGSTPEALSPSAVLAQAEGPRAPPQTMEPVHVVLRVFPRSAHRTVVRTRSSVAVTATARSATATTFAQASVSERVQAVSRATSRSSSAGAARPERHSSSPPNREPQPPAPGPDRPDMSSAGQGGGQGLLLPLVLAALSVMFALFAFALLPRVLPLPAFRKPRRIVLPPWHPG
jgi:hypothetical protein